MVSAVSMKHVCVRYLAVDLGPYSICPSNMPFDNLGEAEKR